MTTPRTSPTAAILILVAATLACALLLIPLNPHLPQQLPPTSSPLERTHANGGEGGAASAASGRVWHTRTITPELPTLKAGKGNNDRRIYKDARPTGERA